VTTSNTSPSTGRAARRPGPPGAVDVYLLPAVVGGGVGDIDEVLTAGRRLARAGFPLLLYRRTGRPLPPAVDGPWDWPPVERRSRLAPRAPRALTVAPAWGVVAAPARNEAFGRPGPWAAEAADVERAYGPEATVHVSLEEFARTLTPREETAERLREGGIRGRERPARLARAEAAGEVEEFRRAYRTFRAFDRANVLGLFASFRYDRPFAREFPEAVQTGPLWPARRGASRPRRRNGRRWVWYASPASASTIAPAVFAGLRAATARPTLLVRSPRPWPTIASAPGVERRSTPQPADRWRREFREADLRIVTGSRTLLEALEGGGPFLYFNGVLGTGRSRRRHRPEKIVELLHLARRAGWAEELVRDLDAFSRGRRVAEVVARAATGRGPWSRFPPRPAPVGFAPGFEDAGEVLVRIARELAEPGRTATELVACVRRASQS
jgi:hypothetical protein